MPFELFDFIFGDEVLWIPRLHLSQLFNPSIHVKPLFEGQDGTVELDYVSDRKHLIAMNSMTVGSIT